MKLRWKRAGIVVASVIALPLGACGGESETAPAPETPNEVSAMPAPAPSSSAAFEDPPGFALPGMKPSAAGADAGPLVAPVPLAEATPVAGSLPPAKKTTLPLAKRTGDPADEAIVDGDQAFETGDYATAQAKYEAAQKLAKKRGAPLVGLARVAIAKTGLPTDYASAVGNPTIRAQVAQLQRAVKKEPDLGASYVELGRALLLLGDANGAIVSLRKGATMLPDEAEAHSALGVALLATGHRAESLTELQRAVDLDAGSAARHGNLATVLFMNGRVPDAIKEYEINVRLADGDARAHSDLGTALLANNDFEHAVPELKRAIAIDANRSAFHSNLGYALQLQGKVPDAIAEYREALRIDPKNAGAWINLATALAKDPKTRGDARAALDHARQIDPTDPRVKANVEELDALEKGKPSH